MSLLFMGLLVALVGDVSTQDNLNSGGQSESSYSTCKSVQVPPDVNITWVRSAEIWFFPLITRGDLILTAKLILPEAKFMKMSEEQLVKDSCLHYNWKSGDMFMVGRKVKELTFHFNLIRRGAIDWELDGEYKGSTYITHTDNMSFAIAVDVFADGSRGGYVMIPDGSPDTFSADQISMWKQKLLEVGFLEEDILEIPLRCAKNYWENRKASLFKLNAESAEVQNSQIAQV